MKYLIGIDAGGTKTVCAVSDLSGKILISETGKSSNYLIAGAEKTSANLFDVIFKCLKRINGNINDVMQIVIGIAGAGRLEDARKLEKILIRRSNGKIKSVKVVSDAIIALEGAFPDSTGCILIAGTGSILFGKDRKRNLHRVGGFGRFIGDEGSGYSIGRKAVQVVSKFLDGQTGKSLLSKLILQKMKIISSEDLITIIYKENFDIASLAPLVIFAAGKRDKSAIRILDEEANELVLHIKAIMKKMKVKKINVVFIGSLIANKNVYPKLLTKKIKSTLKTVKITKPIFSPVEGAILIAKKIVNG